MENNNTIPVITRSEAISKAVKAFNEAIGSTVINLNVDTYGDTTRKHFTDVSIKHSDYNINILFYEK